MKISGIWAFILISVLVVLFIFVERHKQNGEIQENGILVNVKITDIIMPAKSYGVFSFRCKFSYAGEIKELDSPTSVRGHGRKYIGVECPALYSPKKDEIRVLITIEDFQAYKIPVTDSVINIVNEINSKTMN